MSDKKIIAVVGATGAQGGGLVRAILGDPSAAFAARALTRNPGSPAAKELAALGAEVVAADLDDPSSLVKALDGAYGAFFVTDFWAHLSVEREQAQARALAEAAAAAGVRHAVWSTLPDTRQDVPLDDDRLPILEGRYTTPHFDGKAEANRFFTEAGVPTTFLNTTFYFENFLGPFAPARQEDGTLAVTLPMAGYRIAGIAVEDIGRVAFGVFKRPELIGRSLHISGDHLTGDEIAAHLTAALGEPVAYRPQSLEDFRAAAGDEFANTFGYYQLAEEPFLAARDLTAIRALNPALEDFPTWLARHKHLLGS
ncbi:NmrA/HSCARG family protein [Sphaerisporangium sp. B11E5]|uniref:NmrA/HSCARG family protein n=1 Tax=Sphaerisporangium sp. B11E5 TaxID=3153563 RepID=UPI00325CEE72